MRGRRPNHRVLASAVLIITLVAVGAKLLQRYEVHGRPNALINAKAAYLWSSRYELVNWHQWQPEVLDEARKSNRPLFLDIGVFWNHRAALMGSACFGDPEIAQYLNDNFVCVKVDAAQRPDVAVSFLLQARALGYPGDLPTYVIASPEGSAFVTTGAVRPETAESFLRLLKDARERWLLDQRGLDKEFAELRAMLETTKVSSEQKPEPPSESLVRSAQNAISGFVDKTYGGFLRPGEAGKRLEGAVLGFLLRRAEGGDLQAEAVLRESLDNLLDSALHDHVHGGFFLRTTDRAMHRVDFAKLTEANAQMLSVFARAGVLMDDPSYIVVARGIARMMQNVLWDAVDARFSTALAPGIDPREPGRFYAWSVSKLSQILTPRELRAVQLRFGVGGKTGLEWDPALYSLRVVRTFAQVGQILGLSEADAKELVEDALDKMQEHAIRDGGMPPKDATVYTDVNAIAAYAFAVAGETLDEFSYLEVARRTLEWIMELPRDSHGLLPHGGGVVTGFLQDQVWPGRAAMAMYRATRNPEYLDFALRQLRLVEKRFEDREGWWGLWMRVEDKIRDLQMRQKRAKGLAFDEGILENGLIGFKPVDDGEVASANASAAMLAMDVYEVTGDTQDLELARRILHAFGGSMRNMGFERAGLAAAVDRYLRMAIRKRG